jgi:glycosyltransferase involved in cell wall biosynthesis
MEYSFWECLVIDDGSIDYTQELMEFYTSQDSRIRYFLRPASKPKGANACRNYGFEKSSGEYINFFDSDDLIHPAKLTRQLKFLQNTNNSFVVSQVDFFLRHKENPVTDWQGKIKANDALKAYIKGEISWFTPSILWKRNFLESLDYLFDEELQASQEWEFHIRVLRNNPEYFLLEDSLSFIRRHGDNISYDANVSERKWNYFLARFKVFTSFETNENEQSVTFLSKWFVKTIKMLLQHTEYLSYQKFV